MLLDKSEYGYLERFTYTGYKWLFQKYLDAGYNIVPINQHELDTAHFPTVFMRHDIDVSFFHARKIAEIDHELGINSTFYFLLSSDFYNLFSQDGRETLKYIQSLGHEIGLHFDPIVYDFKVGHCLSAPLEREIQALESITGSKIHSFSFHCPTKELIDAQIKITDYINAYALPEDIKYISDSSQRWRQNPVFYCTPNGQSNVQILSHPIWYSDIGFYYDKVSWLSIIDSALTHHEMFEKNIKDNYKSNKYLIKTLKDMRNEIIDD